LINLQGKALIVSSLWGLRLYGFRETIVCLTVCPPLSLGLLIFFSERVWSRFGAKKLNELWFDYNLG
jgi:hypothetical protein